MVRWCWVNFQCRGVLLILIKVGQGPNALAVCAGGGCFGHFSPVYHYSNLSPSLWEMAQYRLKYCLKGPLNPKQPTNEPSYSSDDTQLDSFRQPERKDTMGDSHGGVIIYVKVLYSTDAGAI